MQLEHNSFSYHTVQDHLSPPAACNPVGLVLLLGLASMRMLHPVLCPAAKGGQESLFLGGDETNANSFSLA